MERSAPLSPTCYFQLMYLKYFQLGSVLQKSQLLTPQQWLQTCFTGWCRLSFHKVEFGELGGPSLGAAGESVVPPADCSSHTCHSGMDLGLCLGPPRPCRIPVEC